MCKSQIAHALKVFDNQEYAVPINNPRILLLKWFVLHVQYSVCIWMHT